MTYSLRLTLDALKDIEKHKKSGDKKLLQKIEVLLHELQKHPRTGTGQPEQLKHGLEGFWSRRINKKHRLVYEIEDEIVTVIVVSAYSHYGGK
ncbi:MAG: Txe/YoeB family addiction module toxin [Bacteroidetes bacterium]|jgi:toxin YoeB|nr:Txe/YoeB family addiction module toxin [Bacteroidota bacterium]